MTSDKARIAICIPCKDESAAIASVITEFQTAIPGAEIVVIDNASTDGTGEVARAAGSTVIREARPGKGRAVARAFADIEADCYLMVDGDGTYDPSVAPQMVALILAGDADMVSVARREAVTASLAYRPGHRLGNQILTLLFQRLFDLPLRDTLSGYRAFSRRFVKSFPTAATGFEIEAELNIHAAVTSVPVVELEGEYRDRAQGTVSKLNTYSDGLRILRRNLRLFRDAQPNIAFSVIAAPWFVVALYLVGIAVADYLSTGQVARFPSLIAGVGAFLVGLNTVIAGMVLERVARNRREAVRLAYLALGPVPRDAR